METKVFYRIGNVNTKQGLWYDYEGNYTGLIHNRFDFCSNSNLLMPYDPNIVGWLSTTDKLNDLFLWFTKEDIKNLEQFGYGITIFEATEYKIHENHWVIKQDNSIFKVQIPIESI